ncbi:hypothetical protein J4448_05405 [Candidatus Woesearchaeota archaeon]|nr:hypothetical protein [Candidatus Woesearchaeota archaeon]
MDPEKKRLKKIISKNINFENIFIGITVILGIIIVINIVLTANLNKDLKKSSEIFQEKLKPAKIELIVVKNSKCADCFDISTIVSHIKNANVNITKQTMHEFDSKEGKALVSKYKIEKVPTVVITGEIDKFNIQGLEKRENALLFTQINPPYTNAATGKIDGRVTLYLLKDSTCEKCNDLSTLILQIKGAGVKIYEEKNAELSSNEGKELISKYNIGFVPSLVLSKDAAAYEVIQSAWPQVGSRENDGSYVLRTIYPPFINLTTNQLRGIVNIIYLTDKSCVECYDVNQHKEILTSQQSFAVRIDKEESYDIIDAKGKELVARYNIKLVPATILSSEIGVYPTSRILRQFFSVENDGSYVFRQLQAVGTYKDLATNKVVKAQQQTPQTQEQ